MNGGGNVYVADRSNSHIQKFDGDGNFLQKWGSTGSGEEQLNLPNAVAVDASGKIFVADRFNNRIQTFEP